VLLEGYIEQRRRKCGPSWNFREEEIKVNRALKGNGIFSEMCNISANFSAFEKNL